MAKQSAAVVPGDPALVYEILTGYEDIADDLNCSEAVVRQRVSRGLNALRTEIGKESR